MNQLSFYRDDEGAPRARSDSAATEALAAFLESDIQDDVTSCRELLARIEGGLDELADPIEFTGNRHAVTFTSDTVILGSHIDGDDSSAMLDPKQVETALRGWLAFIEA